MTALAPIADQERDPVTLAALEDLQSYPSSAVAALALNPEAVAEAAMRHDPALFHRVVVAAEPRPGKTQSDVDFAAACLFAEFTRDPDVIAQLLRENLGRAKYDDHRTYLDRTIRGALCAVSRAQTRAAWVKALGSSGANSGAVESRTLAAIWADPDARKSPVAVIPRLAWPGRLTVYAAPDKSGKSTLLAAGVGALTRGSAFLGEPSARGSALWAMLEEHVNDLAARAVRFGTDPDALHVLEHPADPVATLRAEAERLKPAVVVVDTLVRYAGDKVTEGGSAAQWSPIMAGLQDLARDLGCAVVVLHHSRKSDGEARDSGEITARADVVLEQKQRHADGVSRLTVRARWTLNDFAVRLVGDRFILADGADSFASEDAAFDARVWQFIREHPGATGAQVRNGVGGNAERVDRAVRRLLEARGPRIENRGRPRRPLYHVGEILPDM